MRPVSPNRGDGGGWEGRDRQPYPRPPQAEGPRDAGRGPVSWMRPRGEVPAAWTPGFTAQHCREVRAGGGGCLPPGDRGTRLFHPLLLGPQSRAGGRAPESQPGARGTPQHNWPGGWGLRAASPQRSPAALSLPGSPPPSAEGQQTTRTAVGSRMVVKGKQPPIPTTPPSETPSSSSPASLAPPSRSPPPRSPGLMPPPAPAAHRMPPPPGRPHRSVLRGRGVPVPAQRSAPLLPTRSRSTTTAAAPPPAIALPTPLPRSRSRTQSRQERHSPVMLPRGPAAPPAAVPLAPPARPAPDPPPPRAPNPPPGPHIAGGQRGGSVLPQQPPRSTHR